MDTSSLTVNCPSCQTKVNWSNASTHRPFCSQSCHDKDFIKWANEEQVIAGNPSYDDILSSELDPLAGLK